MNIAIFGAAGSIGRFAAPELVRRGHRVRVVGRNVDKLHRDVPGYEAVAADLADPEQARRAAAGMDAVLYAVGLPYPDFARYTPLMRTAVDAAAAAGVRQLLLISTVYQYGRPRTARVAETHPREPHTRKGIARKAQADVVLGAHRADGLRTAVLVLPDFYGPSLENTYLSAVFAGAVKGTSAPVIGPIDRLHEFVYVPDTAPVIADLFARPDAFDGSIYHLGGAGTIVARDLFSMAYRAAEREPKLFVAGVAIQRLMGVVNPLMREMVEMNYLWTDPVVLDDAKLARVLGPLRKTAYDEGVRAGVDAERAALGASAA
jgi:nucleoside-diphosphate-sugar epimerase